LDSPSTNSPPVAALSSESDFRSIALVRGSRARFVRRCDFFRVISRPHARSYGLTLGRPRPLWQGTRSTYWCPMWHRLDCISLRQ